MCKSNNKLTFPGGNGISFLVSQTHFFSGQMQMVLSIRVRSAGMRESRKHRSPFTRLSCKNTSSCSKQILTLTFPDTAIWTSSNRSHVATAFERPNHSQCPRPDSSHGPGNGLYVSPSGIVRGRPGMKKVR